MRSEVHNDIVSLAFSTKPTFAKFETRRMISLVSNGAHQARRAEVLASVSLANHGRLAGGAIGQRECGRGGRGW